MPLLSRLVTTADHTVRRLTNTARRTWAGPQRSHVEYHVSPLASHPDGDVADHEELRGALHDALEAVDGVAHVEVNGRTGRVVVEHDGAVVTADRIAEVVAAVEAAAGVADRFPPDRPDHPADVEPVLRSAVVLLGDTAGLGLAVAGTVANRLPLPVPVDLSWLGALSENYPQVRRALEDRLGPQATDLVLALTNSTLRGLSRSVTGQLVDVLSRSIALVSAAGVHDAWVAAEPDLHDRAPDVDPPDGLDRGRPVEVPDSQIRRYSDMALRVSVGAAGGTLVSTSDMRTAVAPLVDAMPKAARLSRRAYTSRLGALLAGRGVQVMDARRLSRLDRIDHLVVTDDALTDDGDDDGLGPAMAEVLAAARRIGMRVVVAGSDDGSGARARADRVDGDPEEVARHIRALQADGHVVAVVTATTSRVVDVADLSVGRRLPGRPIPWGVDLLAGAEPADVLAVLQAAPLGRSASRQAVQLAAMGAAVGLARSVDAIDKGTAVRVSRIVDAAAVLGIANGIRLAHRLRDVPATLDVDRRDWHAMSVDEVLAELDGGPDGLSAEDAAARRPPRQRPSPAPLQLGRAVRDELENPLTPVLAAGAAVSAATGSLVDAGMVTSVIGLNALVGGAQRFRSTRAVRSLEGARTAQVRVRRDGGEDRVAVDDLVPGDVILLEAGESVPADCRIIEAAGLQVDESSLTGESLPVAKDDQPTDAAAVADRTSMLYDGTSIAAGEVTAVVVAVGGATESRRAIALAGADAPEAGVEARLEELSGTTIPWALWSGAGVALTGLSRRVPLRQVVDTAVGLAVAAVPEGLPLLATAAQLSAAHRLSERGVLVRNPRAIEALGRADVVCADKTGTLTEGQLRLVEVSDGERAVAVDDADDAHRDVLLAARRSTPINHDQQLPHPTDQAVADGTADVGVRRSAGGRFDVVDNLPFEPGRAYHAVLADTDDGRLLAVKGAPEVVLDACDTWGVGSGAVELDDGVREALDDVVETMASRGLRVLAVAERREVGHLDDVADDNVKGMALRGFIGLADPPRPVSADAVATLGRAGIDLVMVTGDHPSTARGVATSLGIPAERIVTGAELADVDDDELPDLLAGTSVFARVTPSDKVRIVRAYQQAGRVVAVTGDGANDAPAIRLAEVGIAVGRGATDAARQAADVVILEDRLEMIVDALVEGRALWASVREAVAVLVGGNLGEISYTLAGTVLGGRPPIDARQLMLVNLLTDVAPAMALAVRRPPDVSSEELLAEGPDRSLGADLESAMRWRAAGTASGATVAYLAGRVTGLPGRASTIGLLALVGGQLGQTLWAGRGDLRVTAAGLGSAAVLLGVIETPGISHFFGSRPLGPVGLVTGLAGAGVGTAVGLAGPPVWGWVGSRVEERRAAIVPVAAGPGHDG